MLLAPEHRHRLVPDRVMACARTLLRHHAMGGGEGTVQSTLTLAAAWADSPGIGRAWFQLWSPQSCRPLASQWTRPDPSGQTPLEQWKAKATPELRAVLDATFPEPVVQRKPGMR